MNGVGPSDFRGAKGGVWGHQHVCRHLPPQPPSFSKICGIPTDVSIHLTIFLQFSLCQDRGYPDMGLA